MYFINACRLNYRSVVAIILVYYFNIFMQKFKKLNRTEMRAVIGGKAPANCSANCIGGTTVSCSGSTCTANDAVGGLNGNCTGGDGITKYC